MLYGFCAAYGEKSHSFINRYPPSMEGGSKIYVCFHLHFKLSPYLKKEVTESLLICSWMTIASNMNLFNFNVVVSHTFYWPGTER